MLPGFNHNIRYGELVFHVQTEDSGPGQFAVVTQLFLGGHVLAVERFVYEDLWRLDLDEGRRREALRGRMQAQHKAMLRGLTDGRFDDRIAPFIEPALDGLRVEAQPHQPPPFDSGIPPELLRAAEALPLAPRALSASVASAQPVAPSATGPRTSVLRPPRSSVEGLDEINVDGLVDHIDEWNDGAERAPPDGRRRPPPSSSDTIVDARLPAALRAAQERLRQRTTPSDPARSRPTPSSIRRVEVRDLRPPPDRSAGPPHREAPDEAPDEATAQTRPASPPTEKGRPSIPSNDQTMLEIDPLALKRAMAQQRARLEAQKKNRPSQDLEPTRRAPPAQPEVVSEPSLDEVIMGYLKDQD